VGESYRPEPGGFRAARYLVLAVLLGLVAVPVLALLWRGARPELLAGLNSPQVREATVNSLVTSGISALVATAFGAGLALLIERTDVPARNFFRAAFFLPFLIPPFIGAIGWLAVFGPVGYVNVLYNNATGSSEGLVNLYGPGGIIALLALHAYPITYLMTAAALRGVPGSLEEAARASGAGRLRMVRDVTLPYIYPALLAGFILLFVSNLSDFGIPALLGLPVQYQVLPTLIYSYLVGGTTENPLGAASALGTVLLAVGAAAFLLQRHLFRRVSSDAEGRAQPVALGRSRYPVTAMLGAVAFLFAVAPVLALLVGALLRAPGVPLTPENLTLANIERAVLAPATVRGFVNSFVLATGAALLCGVIGALVATLVVRTRNRLNGSIDTLALIPQALPGTVVAVAWILTGIPLGIYNTRSIILFAYVMAFVALVVQAVRGSVAGVPVVLEEAAQLSGASPLRALRDVTLPLAAPAVVVGSGLVFFTAIRELTVSALLVAPGTETLGVVIFNLHQAGAFNASTALALVVALGGLLGVGAMALATRGRGVYGAD
jgi:iron(III) transport system permease protein